MTTQMATTDSPSAARYAAFAEALQETCIISDPWLEGEERFSLDPVLLSPETYKRLCNAAEAVGKIYEELCKLVWQRREWLDEFFHLTPYQKLMWLSSGGNWHVIARLDLFLLSDGTVKMCEMNSDTPSGEAETVVLNDLLHPHYPQTKNPNEHFEHQFCRVVMQAYQATSGDGWSLRSSVAKASPTIGIVYPTDIPEDLSMIVLYKKWFERRGSQVVLGSPFNVQRLASGEVAMFDTPIDIVIRHYKTDWWSEREPVWKDADDFADAEPLDVPLQILLEAEQAKKVTIVNPFGAVLTQNKFTMAFCWKHLSLFSHEVQAAIQTYIPETHRLADVANVETLEKTAWVLKPDYGCEGNDVIIGKFATDEIWKASLEQAIAHRWILQKFFEAVPTEQNFIPNYGVYLLGGEAAGIFTRLSIQETNYSALTAPTFITPEP
jgi:glutathionylspermidine synthase